MYDQHTRQFGLSGHTNRPERKVTRLFMCESDFTHEKSHFFYRKAEVHAGCGSMFRVRIYVPVQVCILGQAENFA